MIKVGTKVREIEIGDIGTVTERCAGWVDKWWVRWETGSERGDILSIKECNIEEVTDSDLNESELSVAECIKVLIDAGYTVTKGK